MRCTLSATLLLFALAPLNSTAVETPTDSDQLAHFTQALAQVGLTPEGMCFDLHDRGFYGGDKYRLPFFDALIDRPLTISPYVRRLTDSLLSDSGDFGTVLIRTQQRTNKGIRLGLVSDPLASYRARVNAEGELSLAVALAELTPKGNPARFVTDEYQDIPQVVRDGAALLLFAMPDVMLYRELALSEPLKRLDRDPQQTYDALLDSIVESEELTGERGIADELALTLDIEALLDSVDFALLNTGATLLAIAAQTACDEMIEAYDEFRLAEFNYEIETPLGLVAMHGSGHDRYENSEHYLLTMDTSGDERYGAVAASSSCGQPFGVTLDLAGDDTYVAEEASRPAFGAGVLGYGTLIDCGGNDEYCCESVGEGSGLFGVGLLCDRAGEDRYRGIAGVQGSGTHGTGILLDGEGSDHYRCYQLSQGYGFTMGVGLLLDVTGHDNYIAEDQDIRFPSAQTKEHNSSLSQGFGFGRRGDFNDGHSWAGGIGMLVDGSGDDSYSCGVFGQGCGYWYGTGILCDKAGGDSYAGQWYCQGSGAHFALGILQEDGGDDTYRGEINMCCGAGHDFSLGWLEDSSGNDHYHCPNLSLGGANANGIGVLWDHAGDDVYISRGVTLGMASAVHPGSLRDFILTLGVFVDGGGNDTYLEDRDDDSPPQPWDFAGDGLIWSRPGRSDPLLAAEKGCAIDAR